MIYVKIRLEIRIIINNNFNSKNMIEQTKQREKLKLKIPETHYNFFNCEPPRIINGEEKRSIQTNRLFTQIFKDFKTGAYTKEPFLYTQIINGMEIEIEAQAIYNKKIIKENDSPFSLRIKFTFRTNEKPKETIIIAINKKENNFNYIFIKKIYNIEYMNNCLNCLGKLVATEEETKQEK